MKTSLQIFVAALSLALMLPQMAVAAAATKVDLVQDVAPGSGEAVDMLGPTGYGFINFNQTANGDLRLTISVKNAMPNTTYSGVFVVEGPTHSTALGYIDVGELTTNGQGNGTATMVVSLEDLQALSPTPGMHTNHFDLLKGVGDLSAGAYVASGLDYVLP